MKLIAKSKESSNNQICSFRLTSTLTISVFFLLVNTAIQASPPHPAITHLPIQPSYHPSVDYVLFNVFAVKLQMPPHFSLDIILFKNYSIVVVYSFTVITTGFFKNYRKPVLGQHGWFGGEYCALGPYWVIQARSPPVPGILKTQRNLSAELSVCYWKQGLNLPVRA